MKTNEIVAKRIEERLKEVGWEKKDLAQALNISPQMVSKITLAKKNITVDEIKEIADVLNTTFEELTKPFDKEVEIEPVLAFMGEVNTPAAKDGLKLAQKIMDAIIENREARREFEESLQDLV
ncbi:helix-turn-helix transcriptional regulator [Natroniella sulfidigena]|uniref:helix-turn-helix domain-containing protein n=1 Tax=Natroniella sulfidigena TaxID=723921 RepID=UPI00200AC49B|nr:helix-turn-helix transcriptional regulator [Natroniella sulfidigena]MCK8816743.1 helix-turn-helix transcriptional regulator [Natroniella sulfidigena]